MAEKLRLNGDYYVLYSDYLAEVAERDQEIERLQSKLSDASWREENRFERGDWGHPDNEMGM